MSTTLPHGDLLQNSEFTPTAVIGLQSNNTASCPPPTGSIPTNPSSLGDTHEISEPSSTILSIKKTGRQLSGHSLKPLLLVSLTSELLCSHCGDTQGN